jgi:hypothetical protein
MYGSPLGEVSACFWADENQHRLPSVEFDCPGGPKPECRSDNSPLSRSGSLTGRDPVDTFGRDPEVRGGFGEGSLGLVRESGFGEGAWVW